MATGSLKDIGDHLNDKGLLSLHDLRTAREVHKSTSQDLADVIIDLGFVKPRTVVELRAKLLNLPFIDLTSIVLDSSLIKKVPASLMKQHLVLPIEILPNKSVLFAVVDPHRCQHVMGRIETGLGVKTTVALAVRADMERLFRRLFGAG
jgi:general secretion pathway protein E/type IV pilus assembly protein PilB